MLKKQLVKDEEEQIRNMVQSLPDNKKKLFYELNERKLKDPDTYAILVWLVGTGLHYFYLGRFYLSSNP